MQVAENNKGADFDAEEEDPRLTNTVEDVKLNSPNNRESNTNEVVESRNLDMEIKLLLSKDVEELNFKINSLDSQLIEVSLLVVDSWFSSLQNLSIVWLCTITTSLYILQTRIVNSYRF